MSEAAYQKGCLLFVVHGRLEFRWFTTLSITLSEAAEAKLRQQAEASGEALDVYASRMLEQVATAPKVDEILAPFRKEVEESGMSDHELDSFFEDVREKACRRN